MKAFGFPGKVVFFLLLASVAALSGCRAKVDVRGTVGDMRDGAPLAGAVVRILDMNGEEADDPVTTDEAGAYEFRVFAKLKEDLDGDDEKDPAQYTLEISAPGFWPHPNEWQERLLLNMADATQDRGFLGIKKRRVYDNALTAVKLLRKVSVKGTVLEVAGPGPAPVPGAGLMAGLADANGAPVGAAVAADAAGNYEIFAPECWDAEQDGSFAVGQYFLRVQPATHERLREGLVPETALDMAAAAPAEPAEGGPSRTLDTVNTDTVVVRFVVVRGAVTNNCGGVMEGAAVALLDQNGAPVRPGQATDAEGAYSFHAPRYWVADQACALPAGPDAGTGPACAYIEGAYTLSITAEGFGDYPSEVRPADPLQMADAPGDTSPPVLDNENTSVVLLRNVTVSGVAQFCPDGDPVAGAVVHAADQTGAPVCASATTDAQGAYTLTVPQAWDSDGDRAFTVEPYTLVVEAEGFWAYPSDVTPSDPFTVPGCDAAGELAVDLGVSTLYREIVIRGVLNGVTGPGAGTAPLAGITIQAEDLDGTTVGEPVETDADGAYTLVVPECWDADGDGAAETGLYRITVVSDEYQSITDALIPDIVIDVTAAVETDDGEGGTELVIEGDDTDIVAAPTVVVRGVVTGNCGEALAGVAVALLDGDLLPVAPASITDEAGAYEARAPRYWVTERGCTPAEGAKADCVFVDGVYTLQMEAEGYGAYPSEARPAPPLAMADAAGTPPVLDTADTSVVLLRNVTVSGVVAACPEDTPLAGALVTVLDGNGDPVVAPVATDETGAYTLTVPQAWDADGDGVFTVGQYALAVEAAGYWSVPSEMYPSEQPFDAPGCDTQGELAVDLGTVTLVREVVVRGVVAIVQAPGLDTAPLDGALVQAVDALGAAVGTYAWSGADGRYEIIVPECWDADGNGVSEPGLYTLTVQPDTYRSLMEGIRVEPAVLDVTDAVPDGETGGLLIDSNVTDLVVTRTVWVAGSVSDNCGEPVVGAEVTLLDAQGQPVAGPLATDAAGGFVLPAPEYWVTTRGCDPRMPAKADLPECDFALGVYTLQVTAENHAPYPPDWGAATPLNMGDAVLEDGIPVYDNENTAIVLPRDILLEGAVLDYVSGLPIEGAQVWAVDSLGADVAGPAVTDETGHYSLVVPQGWDPDGDGTLEVGVYALRVAAEHYWPFPSNLTPSEAFTVPGCTEPGGTAVAMADIELVREVIIRGLVLDLADDAPIEGAMVQPADINGTPVGSTAVTDAEGVYELTVPQVWDLDGVLDGTGEVAYGEYTLRCQAMGYQEFPTAIRPSLPIDVEGAPEVDGDLVIDDTLSTLTVVKLIALPGDVSLLGSISGGILSTRKAGVLVVATNDVTGEALTTFSGFGGEFVVFNVPAGTYTVEGYALGVQLNPAPDIAVAESEHVTGVALTESGAPLNTVSGSVQLVNAPGGATTSVVLAVESTFDPNAARGVVPPGLRVGNVTGAFTIPNVPDGRYVVLAAFENDDLVRDPDLNIAGTQIVHITVSGGGSVTIPDSFKITGALALVGPGADGPEAVDTLTPTLEWADDSSEDGYDVFVYDSFGNTMWSTTAPKVSGSPTVSLVYAGAPLEAGMYYQFKAFSFKGTSYISATEDLRGVFYYEPPK